MRPLSGFRCVCPNQAESLIRRTQVTEIIRSLTDTRCRMTLPQTTPRATNTAYAMTNPARRASGWPTPAPRGHVDARATATHRPSRPRDRAPRRGAGPPRPHPGAAGPWPPEPGHRTAARLGSPAGGAAPGSRNPRRGATRSGDLEDRPAARRRPPDRRSRRGQAHPLRLAAGAPLPAAVRTPDRPTEQHTAGLPCEASGTRGPQPASGTRHVQETSGTDRRPGVGHRTAGFSDERVPVPVTAARRERGAVRRTRSASRQWRRGLRRWGHPTGRPNGARGRAPRRS